MDFSQVFQFINSLYLSVINKGLNDAQEKVIRELWENPRKKYKQISESCSYSEPYVKKITNELWQILEDELKPGEKVNKGNFRRIVELSMGLGVMGSYSKNTEVVENNNNYITKNSNIDETNNSSVDKAINTHFLGRDRQLDDIDNLVGQGAKIIVIYGKGGVGKTSLAKQYFKRNNYRRLKLWMAKEVSNITPVTNIVEEWLRKEFNEDCSADFSINLERLRNKLQEKNEKIGICINTLETVLDGQGKLIDARRPYLRLLEILMDSDNHSLTLITSRERLSESSLHLSHYLLEGLEEKDWQLFFDLQHIIYNPNTLNKMWLAYGGNPKAMQILYGEISTYYDGNIDAFWKENQENLLSSGDLQDLVANQFKRLEEINPQAYNLLCRLGCYRYQDIPSIGRDGLLCLLWDVENNQHFRVIQILKDLSLIENKKGQYWLHPVIREEAIFRLRNSQELEIVNIKMADFWTGSISKIETVTDALTALEACYHYIEIKHFESAAEVILKIRPNNWNLPLGCFFYQFGLLKTIISVIERIINYLKPEDKLSKLYNILGYTYRTQGNIIKALECYDISDKILEQINTNNISVSKLTQMFSTGLCKLDLWEIEEAKAIFQSIYEITLNSNNYPPYYPAICLCCLALVNSFLDSEAEALQKADDAELEINKVSLNPWGQGFNFLFLAITYKNLGQFEKADKFCQRVIKSAEEYKFTQLRAKAINCLAEIHREKQEWDNAIDHHNQAIENFKKLGADIDLGNAYCQRGLTYKKIGDTQISQNDFH